MAISNKNNRRFSDDDAANNDTRPVSASTASFATACEFGSPSSAVVADNAVTEEKTDGYESDSNFLPNAQDDDACGGVDHDELSKAAVSNDGKKKVTIDTTHAELKSTSMAFSTTPNGENVEVAMDTFPSDSLKTFKGNNGGMAQDEELLAELRAISNRGRDRFHDDHGTSDNLVDDKVEEKPIEQLKPWQKKTSNKSKFNEVDVVIAAPAPVTSNDPIQSTALDAATSITTSNFQSDDNLPKTFQGDRGGAAEDADLLAELRAISNKGSNRFTDDGETEPQTVGEKQNNHADLKIKQAAQTNVASDPIKPWQRKKAKKPLTDDTIDVVVAAPTPANPSENALAIDESGSASSKFQSNDNLPKTFKGDRGGAAEDADLLAELRAISNKGSSRFNDEDGDAVPEKMAVDSSENFMVGKKAEAASVEAKSPEKAAAPKTASQPLKPWQRKNSKKCLQSDAIDVVVAAPSTKDPFENSIVSEKNVSVDETPIEPASNSVDSKFLSNDNLPKTFKGDRGGAAEDADLLAELRAISNKGSNRFNDDNVTGVMKEKEVADNNSENYIVEKKAEAASVEAKSPEKAAPSKTASQPLKPWQRKTTKKSLQSDAIDVMVAAPSPAIKDPFQNAMVVEEAPTEPASNSVDSKFQSNDNLPKTFKGDRGGAAEDADLLAELRAISNKGSNRFNDDNATDAVKEEVAVDNSEKFMVQKKHEAASVEAKSPEKAAAPKTASQPVKPWQRKTTKKSLQSDGIDVVVAAPSTKDPLENSIVSEKNISVDETPIEPASDRVGSKFQSNYNLPKTFKGDRGGAAEDADLLAELRAISNKGSNRFNDDNVTGVMKEKEVADNNSENYMVEKKHEAASVEAKSPEKAAAPKTASQPLKPWLRKNTKKSLQSDDIDVVVAAPSPAIKDPFQNAMVVEEATTETASDRVGSKFQSNDNLPKTFKGDRGGAAEDADLLAELRAISNKTAFNRFDDTNEPVKNNETAASDVCVEGETRPLPPWKKKVQKKSDDESDAIMISAPRSSQRIDTARPFDEKRTENNPYDEGQSNISSATSGFKSTLPNTFKGDRGGSAEDADLLAELRAISSKSSTKRLNEGGTDQNNHRSEDANLSDQSIEGKEQVSRAISSNTAQPASQLPDDALAYATPPGSAPSEAPVIVTLDNLADSLKSSNWQFRRESYSFLTDRMNSMLAGNKAASQLNGEEVFSSLDNIVCKALNEKIAGAHDAALALSIMYIDSCKEACNEEVLKNVTSALLKGSSFSSSRKTTTSLIEDLVMKIIEVSPEDSLSVQTTCDLLQQHGLKSKKPKVVVFSAKVILRSVEEFGVAVFPLLALSSHSEILLSNPNNEAREIGLSISAEICRALGSKTPLQSLIDKLKPAQQSQLDTLLSTKPTPSEPTRRLRSQAGQSPEDMKATMKRKQEEAKAQSFASRSAVNLLQVLPETCYKEKIKLDKWSEKVAALDSLIKAGGEQPFKLSPPSSSVNYAPLIRDLSKLLGHTHPTVVSRALESLGMLAEGVGEDLYPQLRPLVPNLVGLFKDKKVCKAVALCLDKMYGNVLSFGHLLDSKDSLPTSLDEKQQKNALVRSSVLEFLGRCVNANGGNGKRGQLTKEYADELCKLACSKLQDSESSTRKAATDLLLHLLKSSDDEIVSVAKESTASLQTSNPRVFKSLQQAINGAPQPTTSKTTSRPTTAPSKAPLGKSESSRPKTAGAANIKKTTAQISSDNVDDSAKLISMEEAIEKLSTLGIPQWSNDIDDDGVLAGIQCKSTCYLYMLFLF
jgi:hypothetical protein